ncbi:MAG: hypothetical protein WCP73_00745 [Eubacteriales bacterium]
MNKKRFFSYLTILCVLLAAFLLMGASCSASTANIQNAVMTTAIDSSGKPADSVKEFAVSSPIVASAELHNAPDATKVTFIWYSGDTKLDSVTVTSTMSDQFVDSHTAGLSQAGTYRVDIVVDDREKPDASLTFTVK